MGTNNRLMVGCALALAVLLSAAPAQAQGKNKDKHKHKEHAEQLHREAHRRDAGRAQRDGKYEEQWEERRDHENRRYDARQNRKRNVPPGWCKGKGNPHNTPENCGPGADRRGDARWDTRDGRYDRDGRAGSYVQAHDAFHLRHDRVCSDRAAQRPLDVRHQIQVRTECKAAHDRWHQQAGVAHRTPRGW